MDLKSSTPTIIRITSAQKYTARRSFTDRNDLTAVPGIPVPRQPWRITDPPPITVAELSPDEVGKRIVIRSGDFLGTVYGTLVGVNPHRNLVAFTTIQLHGKRELTFRNDTEALVVDF